MKILFFTQPSCAPCKVILPTINELVQKYNTDYQGYDLTTPSGKEAGVKYGVVVTPELVLLDDTGKVIAHYAGTNQITNDLEPLLKNGGKKQDYTTLYLIGAGAAIVGIAVFLKRRKGKNIGRISAKTQQSEFLTDMRRMRQFEKAKTKTRSTSQKLELSKKIKTIKNKYGITK